MRPGKTFPPPPVIPHWHVVTIDTRQGVTQSFLVYTPRGLVATVILLAGDNGLLDIQPDGALRRLVGNFLIRSSMEFVRCGFEVVLVDAPSDRRENVDGLTGFRKTPQHAIDIGAVIARMRENGGGRPVWLVGTSNGSTSVANTAIELAAGAGPDGIVLTSSIVAPADPANPGSGTLMTMNLQRITVPTLIVHHQYDECAHTLFAHVPALFETLRKLPIAVEVKAFVGGGPVSTDPCGALHHHGYVGIEAEVVGAIADWIKHPPQPLNRQAPPALGDRLPQNPGPAPTRPGIPQR